MKKEKKNKQEDVTNYYNLKLDAVDQLVDAFSEEENQKGKKVNIAKEYQNAYKPDKLAQIPTWIKALFVKYWVAGAICYFGYMGLHYYFPGVLDIVVIVGVITGIVTDLLVNTAFRYFQSGDQEYNKFMLIPVSGKKIWPLICNIIYGIMVALVIWVLYILINHLIASMKGLPLGTPTIGVEPLLYGLLFIIVDMFFIMIKNFFVSIFTKNKP
ncbi:MAG: hypothetical protein PHG08_07680 [Bacilli bacterium]|jgi:hypothetical protein|nr:hypothetical protein [Bacilli bacterium]